MKSIFSLSLSVSFALRTESQNADVPCGPIASNRAVLRPIGVCSAAEKCSMFLFMMASCTSSFVVRVMSGFVSVAPVFVFTVLSGIVIVERGSLMDLSSALFKEPGDDVDDYRNDTDTSRDEDEYKSYLLEHLEHLQLEIFKPSIEDEERQLLLEHLEQLQLEILELDLIPPATDTDKINSPYKTSKPSNSPSIVPSSDSPNEPGIQLNNPLRLANVLFPPARPFSKKFPSQDIHTMCRQTQ